METEGHKPLPSTHLATWVSEKSFARLQCSSVPRSRTRRESRRVFWPRSGSHGRVAACHGLKNTVAARPPQMAKFSSGRYSGVLRTRATHPCYAQPYASPSVTGVSVSWKKGRYRGRK